MCESDHLFLNHVSINMNGLGFRFKLCINLHNEANDCKNLHVQKICKRYCHVPISTVFDILNRKGLLACCCPETSLTPAADKKGGRWIRTSTKVIPGHGASQALWRPPQDHKREPTSEVISPQNTRRGRAVIADIVILSIQAVFNQNVSIYLKLLFLMKATPVTQNIFCVGQEISVS